MKPGDRVRISTHSGWKEGFLIEEYKDKDSRYPYRCLVWPDGEDPRWVGNSLVHPLSIQPT